MARVGKSEFAGGSPALRRRSLHQKLQGVGAVLICFLARVGIWRDGLSPPSSWSVNNGGGLSSCRWPKMEEGRGGRVL
jgi:hypothetical protein